MRDMPVPCESTIRQAHPTMGQDMESPWADSGHTCNDKNHCLYEHPGDNPPRKAQGIKLSQRRLASEVVSQRTQEVQCEA